MSEGWVKLHRELSDKPIWLDSTVEQKCVLITLLMMANHDAKEWEWNGEKYKVVPGEMITSLPSIVKKCGRGVSIQNVRTALERFEKYGFLTCKSTNKNRLITIVNWELYQGNEPESNRQTNRQLTGNQQATNRQLTANKNDKNDKNVRKDIYIDSAEKIYESYILNKKRYPDRTKKRIIELVKKHGEEQVLRAVSRYAEQVKGTELRFIKESDGFFVEDYIQKYLDANYKEVDPNGRSGEVSTGYNLKTKEI